MNQYFTQEQHYYAKRNKKPRRRSYFIIASLILALGFFVDSTWIQAKAWLAQYLIANAWAEQVEAQQTGIDQEFKPWPWADTWPVARIQAQRLDEDLFVLDGAHGSALAFGPGRLHGTSDPGLPGLSIVGGHRDTHFQFLQQLLVGDELQVTNRLGGIARYEVESMEIVNQKETPLTANAHEDRLLLVTCYPFDSWTAGGDLRFVVSTRMKQTHMAPEELAQR